jgi:hydroxymethylpyrimidine pyrophosphatase-like HAD family hydrolase
MELDPDKDLAIDINDLTNEFKEFSLLMYRYSVQRAKIEAQRDLAKAKLKETRAMVFKRIKADTSVKHTEKSLEAEIDTDPEAKQALIAYIQAEHNATTWAGAVDSMRSKLNCLIQLGSDRRKEM